MGKRPEHDKMSLIVDKSQAIGEFLEWITIEKGYHLAYWYNDTQLTMAPIDTTGLLAEFFGIDLDIIEQEKRAMLDELRVD